MTRTHPFRRATVGLGLVVGLVLATACTSDDPDTASDRTTTSVVEAQRSVPPEPTTVAPSDLAAAICENDVAGEQLGTVQNPELVEISGVVAGALDPGFLWAHNDSGGDPAIYAVGTDGADLGRWDVAGAEARDWEEMAGWYDAEADEHHLYLADIGDNASERASITVYRVPEPTVPDSGGGGTTEAAEAYELVYPDGAHDAEAFFVDPASGDWYILTKAWGTGVSQVFRASDPVAGDTTTLEDTGLAVDLAAFGSLATAADAGGVVVVRTYAGVAVWALDGSPVDALGAAPCPGPSADETQGEAIALSPDATGYYTISEGAGAPIWWFPFSAGDD
jgi:hypothetical protein